MKTLLWGDILHWIHGGKTTLPHVRLTSICRSYEGLILHIQEYSYIVRDKDLLDAHEILKKAGFNRCTLRNCYLSSNSCNTDVPAVHYHIERPINSWPLHSEFRDEEIPNDPDMAFEELETIRLYRLENTLWEIKSLDLVQPYGRSRNIDVEDAGGPEWGRRKEELRWPPGWPLTRVPTLPRYIEALLLHWVRYKDGPKELKYFLKLFDIMTNDYVGYLHWNRMERHCRHIIETLNEHLDLDKDGKPPTGILIRDILLQAKRLLGKRAAGPLYHDINQNNYHYDTRLMPPRFPSGFPYRWSTERDTWPTEKHVWEQEVAPGPDDEVDAGSPPLPKPITDRMLLLRKEFEMESYYEVDGRKYPL